YGAGGGGGVFGLEPSQVFVAPRVPKASLKYPTLAAANPEGRESRTAIAVSRTGRFRGERPGRPRPREGDVRGRTAGAARRGAGRQPQAGVGRDDRRRVGAGGGWADLRA